MEQKNTIFNNIKSRYILKKIFSSLDESLELEIIIYNKQLQKQLNINIEDYKNVVGKYRKIEKNGEGKEYTIDGNILVFEGWYNKGKKNGIGIEYYQNGKIKFEGEYLQGKKLNGKGYDENGNLIFRLENGQVTEYYYEIKYKFEGEYYNGRRWNGRGYEYNGFQDFEIKNGIGKGKLYDYYCNLLFEGEFINGKKNGKGKEYNPARKLLIYEENLEMEKRMEKEKK